MKHLLAVAAACLGVAFAILLLSWTTYFAQLNLNAYDFTLRLAGELRPSSPALIVAIDEKSLSKLGPWPWSRDKLAILIDRIQSGGPRAIAVDILLDDKGNDDAKDELLAAAISRAPAIVLAGRISADTEVAQWLGPNPRFLQPHVKVGHVHADPDLDTISRRIDFYKWAGPGMAAVPAFSLQAFDAAFPRDLEERIHGARVLPRDLVIRFIGGRSSFPQISASDVLEAQVQGSAFKERIVLIGYTAEGFQDQWFTPFSVSDGQKMSGVEIHANAIETFYSSLGIAETSELTVLAALVVTVFLLWWLNYGRRFEGWRFYLLAILMLPGSVAVSWALMKYSNVWFPFPPLLAAIVMVVPGLEVLEIMRVNRDLDGKIHRLSVWSANKISEASGVDVRGRVGSLASGPAGEAWLSVIHASEKESGARADQRDRLMSAVHRNARWRLQAVDFFNEDLLRFLSFNNAVLGSIEDVIVVSDPAGRVVYQNPAAVKLPGYQPNPPFAPDYLKALLDGRNFDTAFANVFAEGAASSLQSVPASDGKRYYNVTLAPIAKSGVVISMHDTTAEHELNQAKNDMVSLVSHELRTPLTSIRGYSDMLVKYDLVADQGKPFLSTIIDESRRLNNLIQSFLDIAYIESGRQKVSLTEFEVAPVLSDMLNILGPVAAEKQIRIDSAADTVRVRADRLLLYQALSNLVTNAIKYSPSGSTVRLNVSNGNGRIRFEIADQGCGIPMEEAGKVFEKFYRRGNKETREQSGFGLGLAFVKEVAVKHGGDVDVESEVGKGSVFTLWIPQK